MSGDSKCVCTGRVIAGRPVVERCDTSYMALALSLVREQGRRALEEIRRGEASDVTE